MELPHLGQNCALKQCNQLDFLPVKCDACSKVFCIEHYQYNTHNCEKAETKNVQVPVCPLCSEPVANRNRQLPDIAVSEHMDKYCKANELIKNRRAIPKTNLQACSFKSCRQKKDVIYLECSDCQAKFCIKHRYPTDHNCPGPASSISTNWHNIKGTCSSSASSGFEILKSKAHQISKSGQAALNRLSKSNGQASTSSQRVNTNQAINSLQGNLNESDALAIALNESRKNNGTNQHSKPTSSQEEEDLALARALQESELEARNRLHSQTTANSNNNRNNCILS